MSKDKEYTSKISELETKIEQLEIAIKENDKEDSKRRNVVLGIIGGCFVLHTIGIFTSPIVIIISLVSLMIDTITGWIILSKFENRDFDLKEELKETKSQLDTIKEEYENFLEEEYKEYSRPRINPTIVNTPINTNTKNNIKKFTISR